MQGQSLRQAGQSRPHRCARDRPQPPQLPTSFPRARADKCLKRHQGAVVPTDGIRVTRPMPAGNGAGGRGHADQWDPEKQKQPLETQRMGAAEVPPQAPGPHRGQQAPGDLRPTRASAEG